MCFFPPQNNNKMQLCYSLSLLPGPPLKGIVETAAEKQLLDKMLFLWQPLPLLHKL